MQNKNYAFIANRKTVEIVTNEKGMIKNKGTKSDPLYVIIYTEHNAALFPYNLPPDFQIEGKQIVFSGNIKEMYFQEDEHGVYFEIEMINACP